MKKFSTILNEKLVKWTNISEKEYFKIYNKYEKLLTVFSSFTNKTPGGSSSPGNSMTEWGFSNEDDPLLKWVSTPSPKNPEELLYSFYVNKKQLKKIK